MEEEYSFRPQINTRSRRLARHAPTLRERQEQKDQLRRPVRRGQSPQSRTPGSPAPAPRSVVGAQTATPPRAIRQSHANSDNGDDEAVESVWALWRAVAARESRDEEKVFVESQLAVAEDAAMPRPSVVHVTTILAMLGSLGIHPPRHTALINKFLLAVGAVEENKETAVVVEAERFAYVFSTVWRAAVTNHTRWSPVPVRSCATRGASPVVRAAVIQPAHNPSCHPLSASTTRSTSTSSSSSTSPPSSTVASSTSPELHDDASLSSSAKNSRSSLQRSASCDEKNIPSSDERASTKSSSSVHANADAADQVSSENGSFLHTNLSRTSFPSPLTPQAPTHLDNEVKHAQPSPVSVGENKVAGLSLSPEPRNPHGTSSLRTSSHCRSPLGVLSASMLLRGHASRSLTRVLPSDSHLLTSTTSREMKRATKRVPGGLMRECTFKPIINAVSPPLKARSSLVSAEVGLQRRARCADVAVPFPSSTQPLYKEHGNSARWTEKPLKQSLHMTDGGLQQAARRETVASCGDACPVPLAPGFDIAVRRMIAARQQQKRQHNEQQQVVFVNPTDMPLKRASAVRRAECLKLTHQGDQQQPLLYVDVDLPKGQSDRIALFRGANVAEVAKDFSARHNLDDRLRWRLERVLHDQLRAFS